VIEITTTATTIIHAVIALHASTDTVLESKKGIASAFYFWFSNVKIWRAISIHREAEAPVRKLERRE